MRILYFSVHAILEFDEIRLFHQLGYTVFPLGAYFGGKASQAFRPEIEFSEDYYLLLEQFKAMGGVYSPHNPYLKNNIPEAFVDLFDVCIVMHEPSVLRHYWGVFSRRPVVWRTIGASILAVEDELRELRRKGLHIVRYSPCESLAPNYIGHDAIIRFSKRVSDFAPWAGTGEYALTFSNDFVQRFPLEADFYREATTGIRALLGGNGNGEGENKLGLISYAEQLELLSKASAYFYCSGTFITYTLNFMEAWLAGAPMVAVDCRAIYPKEQCTFAEIPMLIRNGHNGFLVKTPQEARKVLGRLLGDPDLARSVSAAGRETARSLFDEGVNGQAWKVLLEGLARSRL